MKTTILIALIALLSPATMMGQDDIRATISYNQSDSTLTIEVIQDLSKHPKAI